MLVHATAIGIGGRAVLLMGASGCGKSDLALRLIDRGALLIADDQVELQCLGDRLCACAPPTIAGLIEMRGVGIVRLPFAQTLPVALLVDLDTPPERLPEPADRELAGHRLPFIALCGFEASAPLKVERALMQCCAAVEARS